MELVYHHIPCSTIRQKIQVVYIQPSNTLCSSQTKSHNCCTWIHHDPVDYSWMNDRSPNGAHDPKCDALCDCVQIQPSQSRRLVFQIHCHSIKCHTLKSPTQWINAALYFKGFSVDKNILSCLLSRNYQIILLKNVRKLLTEELFACAPILN